MRRVLPVIVGKDCSFCVLELQVCARALQVCMRELQELRDDAGFTVLMRANAAGHLSTVETLIIGDVFSISSYHYDHLVMLLSQAFCLKKAPTLISNSRCYTCFFCRETACVQSSGEHRRTCAGGKRRQPTLPSREDGFMCFLCGNTTLRPHHTFPCDNCRTSLCEDLTSEHLQTCSRGVIQRQVGEEHDKAQRDNNPLGGGGVRQSIANGGEGGEEVMSDDDDDDDDDDGGGDRGDISQPGPSGLRPLVNNRVNDLISEENSPDGEDAIDTPHLINRVGALGDLCTRMKYSIPSSFATDPIGLLSNFRDYYISEIENYMNYLGGHGNFTSLKILLEVKVTLLKQQLTEDDDFREHFITTPARLVTLEEVGNLIDTWSSFPSFSSVSWVATPPDCGADIHRFPGDRVVHSRSSSIETLESVAQYIAAGTPVFLSHKRKPGSSHSSSPAGSDGIHYEMLRHLSLYIRIWESSSVPEDWLDAVVLPVQKPEFLGSSPKDFRPVALMSCLQAL
ncbi:uncharacterized protein [Procambarus clarkii]|uniref:uncharacterized protein n=1 Tax=Procambarus clarkii TaxID=6728 RepID=UPI0037446276